MHDIIHRHDTDLSASSKSSRRSDESYDSHSTTPTSMFESPQASPRPSLQHAATAIPRYRHSYDADPTPHASIGPRDSRDTYASTNASVEDLFDEPEEFDYANPDFKIPEYKEEVVDIVTQASTPQDFAQYFPSQRRLLVHHDETTSDGNMNLRVDTEVSDGSTKIHMQLYHLRMHDLKARQFSLRRYCRDSGREVCHSTRRYTKPASQRPGIHRSMSNALASLRSKPEFKRANSGGLENHSPKRQDSGYGSNEGEDGFDDDDIESFMVSEKTSTTANLLIPTNTTKLEFSNYAQVDVKRRGAKNAKRYEFEYWGSSYSWKRVTNKDGAGKSISFHLIRDGFGPAIAHIVPELRSPSQVRNEELAGGWVPPCSLWVSDPKVLTAASDVADVIVATGLIALVDDSIKRHFSTKPKPKFIRQISLPLTPLKMDMEFVGPKTFVEQMFRRRRSVEKERPGSASEHKQSPLRFASPVAAY